MYISVKRWDCRALPRVKLSVLTRLKEADFDCGCIIVRSFLYCSVYYSWLFLNPSRLQTWLELDKKQECKAISPFPYVLYYS